MMGFNAGVMPQPFGGVNQSGVAREGGKEGITEYTCTVAVIGLIVLAFWAGYRTGQNARPTNQ